MKVIYFDTETTGLLKPPYAPISQQPHIIDIGAVVVVDGIIKEQYQQLVKPPCKLPAVITKITKLTDDELVDAPTFKEVYPYLKVLFDNTDYVVAHNAKFDMTMLKNELLRIGCFKDFPWPKNTICTVEEFKPLFGRYPKLTDVYLKVMGVTLDEKHRALSDAFDLYKICEKAKIPNV